MAYRQGAVPAWTSEEAWAYLVREGVLQSLPRLDEAVLSVSQWDWRTSGTVSAVRWQEGTIIWLAEHCRFRDPQRVLGFLRHHPGILEVLGEAYPVLQQHFGSRPLLVAEVIADPESKGDDDVLFIFIRTALGPDVALSALEQFDEEWFLNELDRTEGRLNFDLEFI